jgi:hypothetical protein
VETKVDWLGTRSGLPFDIGAVPGAFGWNESAGAALADGGLDLDDPGRLLITALRYHNRADPSVADAAVRVIAWYTTFNSVGARMEYAPGWTVIALWMSGQTSIAPGGSTLEWPFNARYLLLSKSWGRQRLSARYDRFEVDSRNAEPDGAQSGHAWTVAYALDAGKSWTITLELLRVTSSAYSWGEDTDNYGPGHGQPGTVEPALRHRLRVLLTSAQRKRPASRRPAFRIGCLPALRSAAAPSAVPSAAAAAGALLRLIYPQGSPAEVLAIQLLNGLGSVGAGHLNESKAAGPAGVPVGDEAYGLNGAVLREQLTNLTLSGRKRKVSDIDLRHAIKLQRNDMTWPGTIRLFSDSEAGPVQDRRQAVGKGKGHGPVADDT